MLLTLERSAIPSVVASNGGSLVKETFVPVLGVDFGLFGAKEIRDVLKSKAHCLHAGFLSNHAIIKTFNEIRGNYILKVGLPTYLNQMLGELGKVQMQHCRLYGEDNHQIKIHLNGNHNQPVQRFIARQFRGGKLPFKVEACRGSNPGRVEVRYL